MSISSNEEEFLSEYRHNERSKQEKTQEKYKVAYDIFVKWKTAKNYQLFTENTFLEYFTEMGKKCKPTTLWCTYSKLRSTVLLYNNIDIRFYPKVINYLKKRSIGFTSKKSKVLSANNVEKFLKEAPDIVYLAMKVALIFGVTGACSRKEIVNISIKDIEQHGDMLLVKIKNANNKISRSFTIHEEFYQIVKKYMALRTNRGICERFFQNYQKGKCTAQPIGINTLGLMPKKIAEYLGLPNPDEYTGHSFRRTSRVLQVGSGPINVLSSVDSGCQSNTDEDSLMDTSENVPKLRAKRTESINFTPGSEPLHNETNLLPAPNVKLNPNCENHEVNPNCENHEVNPNSDKNPSSNSTNEKPNTEMQLSCFEIALSPPHPANVKTDPEQEDLLESCYEDPLSPSPSGNERSNRQKSSCFTFENTSYENNMIQSLAQNFKTSDKNVTFVFKNCTFTNCFNN